MGQLYDELIDIEARLKDVDSRIRQLCRDNEVCKRILTIPGIGEPTATAIVSAVPNPGDFETAGTCQPGWGLVPRQSSSNDR